MLHAACLLTAKARRRAAVSLQSLVFAMSSLWVSPRRYPCTRGLAFPTHMLFTSNHAS